MSSKQLFIEPRSDGGYSVKRPDAQRASAVCDTQAQAIARARELNPGVAPAVARVRHTDHGYPDQWRKA
jgi:hypothetical protein